MPAWMSGDQGRYRPTPERPLRGKEARAMQPDAHFELHRHAWAQVAYCASGVIQVNVQDAPQGHEVTYRVPPSRAVWIAPGALHSVTVLELAELHTLYMDASVVPAGWQRSRAMAVSPLLRELLLALEHAEPGERERRLADLALHEIASAQVQTLGVPLPRADGGDKRLRALCQGVIAAPAERATLADWARHVGASERTAARLFRDELGTSYQQWRQQAVLAHALPLLARGTPVGQVAAACGYASESAFSAMFRAALGQSPSSFRARAA